MKVHLEDLFHVFNFKNIPKLNLFQRLLTVTKERKIESKAILQWQLNYLKVAIDTFTQAQIVVDFNSKLVLLNAQAISLFNLSLRDIGRPFQDLKLSYRPVELRSYIEQVYTEGCSLEVTGVTHRLTDESVCYLDVKIVPLKGNKNDYLGVSIIFTDMTLSHRLQEQLSDSQQKLDTTIEELQLSNQEAESLNEELQLSNEELETSKEELQSMNEEIETANRELLSTNNELQSINRILRQRTDELNETNEFLESLFASIGACVIVIDRAFSILSWNQEAEDLWGLRAEETKGQEFFSLDIGLPCEQLREMIQVCLSPGVKHQVMALDAINRRGKLIRCNVTCKPLNRRNQQRQGVILLMEQVYF